MIKIHIWEFCNKIHYAHLIYANKDLKILLVINQEGNEYVDFKLDNEAGCPLLCMSLPIKQNELESILVKLGGYQEETINGHQYLHIHY